MDILLLEEDLANQQKRVAEGYLLQAMSKTLHIDKHYQCSEWLYGCIRCAKFLDHAKKTDKDEFLKL